MAGITWQNGRDITHAVDDLKARRDKLVALCEQAVQETLEEAVGDLKKSLLLAVTETGHRREAQGGQPGRYRSGEMVNSVDSNATSLRQEGEVTWGDFGWFAGRFQQYFLEQDLGLGVVANPAQVMLPVTDRAISRYKVRIHDIMSRGIDA